MVRIPRIDRMIPGLFKEEEPGKLLGENRAKRIINQVKIRKQPEDVHALLEHLSGFDAAGREVLSSYLLRSSQGHASGFFTPRFEGAKGEVPLQGARILGNAEGRIILPEGQLEDFQPHLGTGRTLDQGQDHLLRLLLDGGISQQHVAQLWHDAARHGIPLSVAKSQSLTILVSGLRAVGMPSEHPMWGALVDAWTSSHWSFRQLTKIAQTPEELRVQRLVVASISRHQAMENAEASMSLPSGDVTVLEALKIAEFANRAGYAMPPILQAVTGQLVHSKLFSLFEGILPRQEMSTPKGVFVQKSVMAYLHARLLEREAFELTDWSRAKTHRTQIQMLERSFQERVEMVLAEHPEESVAALQAAILSAQYVNALLARFYGEAEVTSFLAARKAKEAADQLARLKRRKTGERDALIALRIGLYDWARGLTPDLDDPALDERERVLVRHFLAAIQMQIKLLSAQNASPPYFQGTGGGSESAPSTPSSSETPDASPDTAQSAPLPGVGASSRMLSETRGAAQMPLSGMAISPAFTGHQRISVMPGGLSPLLSASLFFNKFK